MGKALKSSIHLGQFQVATLGIFLSATFCAPPTQAQAIVHPQLSPTPRATRTPQGIHVPPPVSGRVIRAQLFVSAPGRVNQCPERRNFTGDITTSGPAEVTYTWVSFDGGTWPQGTLHFSGRGTQRVSQQVTLGKAGEIVHGWLQLKVLSPNAVLSPRAQYTVNCSAGRTAGRVIRAQVSVASNPPRNVPARCPIQENFNGTITTNGPAQVTYTWTSSDNSTWPQGTLRFASAGTQTVRETWKLGAPGQTVHGWVRLKVLSPNAYTSNPAAFSFRCP